MTGPERYVEAERREMDQLTAEADAAADAEYAADTEGQR